MKVTGIVTSPRKNGNTALLVDKVIEGAKKSGAEVEIIYLPELNIEFCHGCLGCMRTGKCPISDDFEMVKSKMLNSDGLIIGTPTYMNSYNALLKKLLERFGLYEHMTSEVFGNKYIAVVTTSLGQANGAINALSSQVGIYGRAFNTGNIALNLKGKGSKDYPETLKSAENLGEKLVHDITNKTPYKSQNLLYRMIVKLFVRPQFTKVITQNKDGFQKAVYDYLHKNNLI